MKKLLALLVVASNFWLVASAQTLNDKVTAMSDSGRQKFVGMLVRQSGKECAQVQRTFYQGSLDNKSAIWNIRCDTRADYAIVFYSDEANTTRVMSCNELKTLGAPDCFKKLPRR